jgi:FSR family fosmidomycin resistance protein-like MFS transporter
MWLAGIALTLFEAAGVAGVLVAGSISDRLGRRKTLLASLLGAPLFLFAGALHINLKNPVRWSQNK